MGSGKSIFTSVWPGVSWTFLALCQRAGLGKGKKAVVFQWGRTLLARVQREAKHNRLGSKSTLNGMNGEQF